MIRPLQEEVRSRLRSGVAITNLTQCVEELVLNSLDAGASSVTVRLDVPNFKIQVSDNGSGIAFGDLNLVGERYSSSKCHVLKDLEKLSFYGFRGEALASVREICDVLEIVSRHRSSYQTYCKLFRNSQVLELAESRFPRASSGTTVTIHNIFANLPVRRKSIAETLDFERVRQRIASIALIHPKTAFLLINDSTGAKCLQTRVCKSSVSTFSQLFGNLRSRGLQIVQFQHKDFKVSGFISTDTHHSKSLQFLFVNSRLLLKTKIHKLVNNILGKSELLRKLSTSEVNNTRSEDYQSKVASPQNVRTVDKYGIFVLNIDCLVTEYDICLEPSKTLIEFQDWEIVLYCVQRCTEEFLVKHNLILHSEQSPNSEESRRDDDGGFAGRSCCTSLEAFEYKREIETSRVKKSLHSSTVFRPRKAEAGEGGSQDDLKDGLSISLQSDEKHRDGNNDSDTVGNGTLCHCSHSLIHVSGCPGGSDCKSVSEAEFTHSIEKSVSCLDVTTKVDKCLSSCTDKNVNEPSDGNHGNQFNDRTSYHGNCTTDSITITASNSAEAAGNCSYKVDCSPTDLAPTLPISSQCIPSDSQKTSTCQSRVNGQGNVQRNLLKEFSNKNTNNAVFDSNAFPESRKACYSGLSIDQEEDFQTTNLGLGSVGCLDHEKGHPVLNSSSFQQSSDTNKRHTGATCSKANKSRTKVMPAFTSPCPITLQRVWTRKRHQDNKETSSSGSGLTAKNRRLITLQGSFKRRERYKRNSAAQSSDVTTTECNVHSVSLYGQILDKNVDNSCSSKSPTTPTPDCEVISGAPLCPDNSLNSTMTRGDTNPSDFTSGATVSCGNPCDSTVPQPDISDPIGSVCLSSLTNKQSQAVEGNSGNSAAVVSNINSTDQEGTCVIDKCTESLRWPQKESATTKKGVSTEKSSQCSSSSESNLEPISDDICDTRERRSSLEDDWYCTFDTSLGRKLFINKRTGHSSFDLPIKLNVEVHDCSEMIESEANGAVNEHLQHAPHPVASHLSFSCTPWLPREDRRRQASVCDDGNTGVSQLAILYQEHQDSQETDEKLCKWTDANTLKSYEQNLFNNVDKTVADMLNSWQNPVFTAPEKDVLMANKPDGCVKNQISVHNVVHPYRFTRDMLASMRVLRQLDDKFIVGVVSQEGDDDGLLVLVDQHAAHERVRLEHLQSELFEDGDNNPHGSSDKPQIKSSPVSPPLEFALFKEEVRLLKTFRNEMERIGIRFVICESSQVSEETSISVHGVPSVLVEREVSEVKRGRPSVAVSKVKGIIREHLEHVSVTCGVPAVIPKVIFQVISSQACHGAVKFGEPLGVRECQELIARLSKCQLPFQCAHGRPSAIPLADLRFLGKKMTSQEVVCRPRLATLRSACVKEH